MHVRMKTHITGARNGVEWPERGGVLELPDHEARDLIANGYAEACPAPAGGDVALESLKVGELRQLAEDWGVDLGDARKKSDIVAALQAAAEEDEEDEDA